MNIIVQFNNYDHYGTFIAKYGVVVFFKKKKYKYTEY